VASIAVSQAAFAGFGVLRRRPWAPLVWSTVYVAVIAGVVLLLGAAFVSALGRLATLGAKASVTDMLGLLGAVLGGYLLLIVSAWVIGAVINMAVVRAVLAPEAAAFAYMRLGRDELRLMLANLVLFVLYTMVSMVLAIPTSIAMAAVVLTWRDAAPFVSAPIQLITWAVTVWLGRRFCMVPPMIFSERRFRLFESWTMTRGHVWRLFGVGAMALLACIGVYVVLAGVAVAIAWPMVASLGASVSPQTFFTQSPQRVWNELAPFLVLYAALVFVGSTFLLPVFFAPWPEAYRQLTHGELASTFS
jgi:hypothetical protein